MGVRGCGGETGTGDMGPGKGKRDKPAC